MIVSTSKYFFLIVCSAYAYMRLLNLQIAHKVLFPLQTLAFSLLSTSIVCIFRNHAPIFSVLCMVVLSMMLHQIIHRNSFHVVITTTVVAYGFSYAVYFISSFAITVFEIFVSVIFLLPLSMTAYVVLQGIFQLILIFAIFQIKRLRNGMPFLQESDSSEVGTYLCVILLISTTLMLPESDYYLPLVFAIACAAMLFVWWRIRITQEYKAKLKNSEIADLQRSIDEKDQQIEQLTSQNAQLAKIIHKDNKLIPALELSVREFLLAEYTAPDATAEKAAEILAQLSLVSQERTGIVQNYERQNKALPSTKVPALDTLFAYMLQKAFAQGVEFELTVQGSLPFLVERSIPVSALSPLLADLIDNAILATKDAPTKRVLVCVAVVNGSYCIDVLDSGVDFSVDVLANLGIAQTTTRKATGGSGIGLMTSFELCQTHNISLCIEEFPSTAPYRKKVSLCFDGLRQYRIVSGRASQIEQAANGRNILVNAHATAQP